MKTLKMERFDSHTPFTEKDFTTKELLNRNILAVNVIEKGLLICKKCGKAESELHES